MGGVLGIILLYIGGQLLEGMYLSPRIMGRETGLHPVVVLVAILIGGTLFGLLGIIVAVPVTAVLQVVLHRWHRAWRATWPSSAAPLPPGEGVQEEPRSLVHFHRSICAMRPPMVCLDYETTSLCPTLDR
jgi:AI-2E family transporter